MTIREDVARLLAEYLKEQRAERYADEARELSERLIRAEGAGADSPDLTTCPTCAASRAALTALREKMRAWPTFAMSRPETDDEIERWAEELSTLIDPPPTEDT